MPRIRIGTFLTLIFLSILFTLSNVLAQSAASNCNQAEHDRAVTLANIAGDKIVSQFGGGRNVSTEVNRCSILRTQREFRISLTTQWNGAVFKKNLYVIGGELRTNEDGSSSSFHQSYGNDKVQGLRFWKSIAGGAIRLGSLL